MRPEVHSEFYPYISNFEQTFDIKISKMSMKFKYNDMGKAAAYCVEWITGHKELVFEYEHWNELTEKQKLALFYHEVAHCEKRIDHDENFMHMSYCPKSVMYPSVITDECLNRFWNEYVKELDSKLKN